jgi:hypothetical protein
MQYSNSYYNGYYSPPPKYQEQEASLSPTIIFLIVFPIVWTIVWTFCICWYRKRRMIQLALQYGIDDETQISLQCGFTTWLICCCCFNLVCICPVDDPDISELVRLQAESRARATGFGGLTGTEMTTSAAAPRVVIMNVFMNPLHDNTSPPEASGPVRAEALAAHAKSSWFRSLDRDCDGYVTGSEVRDQLLQTAGLPVSMLAQLWDNVSKQRKGFLNEQEFYDLVDMCSVARARMAPTANGASVITLSHDARSARTQTWS